MNTISSDSDKPVIFDGVIMKMFSGDKPIGAATREELLAEIDRRMKNTEDERARLKEANAQLEKTNELLKNTVITYTKECAGLKAADTERKRLKVRNGMLEEENSELRGRIARLEAEMKRLKADAAPRCRRTGTVQQRNLSLSEFLSQARTGSAPGRTGLTIEEILGWADEHMEKDPARRAQIKSMIYDMCRDRLTEEQQAMLERFDKREPQGRGDVRIEVKDGGVYNENVGRMNMGRRSAAADDLICYYPGTNA